MNPAPAKPVGRRRSRLAEPSTWAGFAILAGQVGQLLAAGDGAAAVDPASIGAIAAAIAAIALRETPHGRP